MLNINGNKRDKKWYINDNHEADQMPHTLSKVSCLPFKRIGVLCLCLGLLASFIPSQSFPCVSPVLLFFALLFLSSLCPWWCDASCVCVLSLTCPPLHLSFFFILLNLLPFFLQICLVPVNGTVQCRKALTFTRCLDLGVEIPRSRGTGSAQGAHNE